MSAETEALADAGPSLDLAALTEVIFGHVGPLTWTSRTEELPQVQLARAILASDWLAAHTAAAERRAITTMLADLDTRVRAAQDEVQGADFGTVLVATVNAYSDGCGAAAHAAVEQIQCHCGEPVAYGFDGDPTHHRGMCAHCDAARCDAYPGECDRTAAEQTSGA